MLQTSKQTWDIKTVTETKIEYLKKIGTKRHRQSDSDRDGKRESKTETDMESIL